MKALLIKGVVSLALLTSVAVAPAGATLIDRGNGLIYDDHLNVTWLKDANLAYTKLFGLENKDVKDGGIADNGSMFWDTANSWIAGMNVANYKGFNNWRLPTTTQPDPDCEKQGEVPGFGYLGFGTGCTGSEMGHLFNVEGITAAAPGVFENVQAGRYWSGTEFAPDTDLAWNFNYHRFGYQDVLRKNYFDMGNSFFGWAVRSPVPEPSTMVLLGSGLVGLIGWRRARRGVVI